MKCRIRSTGSTLCYLLWIVTLHLAGLYLFSRGFLLNRVTLEDRSQCNDTAVWFNKNSFAASPLPVDSNKVPLLGHTDCWQAPRFKRAILLLMDALRFDFVDYDETLPASDVPSFRNKMPIFHRLCKEKPQHAMLFQSKADAPTTTLQRLKALVTGGLPVFIDAGKNFGGDAIVEDNWVEQFHRLGRKTVFTGDDTWMSLFPNQFSTEIPFPSFNVKDLHTVDDGVTDTLFHLIKNVSSWELLVGHFLGIDHCGHRHHVLHPCMASKLAQMNGVLERLVSELDDPDTLLIVLGDHGMTDEGDHGGESHAESTTVMFFYSPRALFENKHVLDDVLLRSGLRSASERYPLVSQIDVVPTLSLLLGVPIPFGNLGAAVPELLFFGSSPWESLIHAHRVNSRQILRYLEAYGEHTKLAASQLQTLTSLFSSAESAREMVYSVIRNGSRVEDVSKDIIQVFLFYERFLTESLQWARQLWTTFDVRAMVFGIAILATAFADLVMLLWLEEDSLFSKGPRALMRNLFVAVACSCLGLLHSVDVCLLGYAVISSFLYLYTHMTALKRLSAKTIGQVGLASWIALGSAVFHGAALSSNSFINEEFRVVNYLICTCIGAVLVVDSCKSRFMASVRIAAMVLLLVRLTAYFKVCRAEQADCDPTFRPERPLWPLVWSSSIVFFVELGRLFASFSVILDCLTRSWLRVTSAGLLMAINVIWYLDEHSALLRLLLPRAVYIVCIVHFVLFLRRVCLRVDVNFLESVALMITSFIYPLMLISGPYAAPVAVLLISEMAHIIWTLRQTCRTPRKTDADTHRPSSWPVVVVWCLASWQFYFALGHNGAFSSINWNAAFVGFDSLESYLISGILVAGDLLGSFVIFGFGLPLLLVNRLTSDSWRRVLFQALAYHTLVTLLETIGVVLLRRHLMVWGIFAPRFMLQVTVLILTDLCLLMTCLVMYIVNLFKP